MADIKYNVFMLTCHFIRQVYMIQKDHIHKYPITVSNSRTSPSPNYYILLDRTLSWKTLRLLASGLNFSFIPKMLLQLTISLVRKCLLIIFKYNKWGSPLLDGNKHIGTSIVSKVWSSSSVLLIKNILAVISHGLKYPIECFRFVIITTVSWSHKKLITSSDQMIGAIISRFKI